MKYGNILFLIKHTCFTAIISDEYLLLDFSLLYLYNIAMKTSWILKRLKNMYPAEIFYKAWTLLYPTIKTTHPNNYSFAIPQIDINFSQQHKDEIIHTTENYLNNNWQIFNKKIETPIKDWNQCPITKIKWNNLPTYKLDYRNYKTSPKYVWEINRFQHIIPLSLSYYFTKEEKYFNKGMKEITDWIDKNPYGYGINWISSIEVGIRVFNWTMFFLIAQKNPNKKIIKSIHQHIDHINKTYSYFSSSNNHITAEAVSVMFVSLFSKPLFERYFSKALLVFRKHINKLILNDGGCTEQSLYYHTHLIEHLLFAVVSTDIAGVYNKDLKELLHKSLDFIGHFTLPNYSLPFIGDSDAGRFSGMDMHIDSQYISKTFYKDSLLKEFIKHFTNITFPQIKDFSLKTFPDSGYTLWKENDYLMIFDHGNIGYPPIFAHGHSDTLSLLLFKGTNPLLIDRGVYGYFDKNRPLKEYKSSLSHNVIQIENYEPSPIWGEFLRGNDVRPEFSMIKRKYPVLKGSINTPKFQWTRIVETHKDKIIVYDYGKHKGKNGVLRWHVNKDFIENVKVKDAKIKENTYSPYVGKEEKMYTIEKHFSDENFNIKTIIELI